MNRSWCPALIATVTVLLGTTLAVAQSSSLYLDNAPPTANIVNTHGETQSLPSSLASASLTAVRVPPPRQFAVHDLVTIVIRESVEADARASIETEKETELSGRIAAFPNLKVSDVLDFRLSPSEMVGGEPAVDINHENEFSGDGDYSRRDSFTARITARIIDIKPNGTLVLEARKFIKNEDETMSILLTGTCRKDDIQTDNTILSTQIYDLRLVKQHTGELRQATKKGFFTKLFEGFFNF